MINTGTLYGDFSLANIQEQNRQKIEELQQLVENLQEQIKLITASRNRTDDL